MLRRLGANDDRFKEIRFQAGINLIVAERSATATATDTRNGSGKSSIIEILHFLLGGQTPKMLGKPAVRKHVFELELDWPGLDEYLRVQRSPDTSGTITLDPD